MTLESLAPFVGQNVVVDTATPLVYIGRLTEARGDVLLLADVDVHDRSESQTSKEVYVMEAKKLGIKANRRSVIVRSDVVVSISLLDEVIVY
ncbi:MAG: hypothetical protein HY720_06375 [Planctomycetes bacterium]|nr:hypothetical protein [Planctomycetota bacterium]